MKAGVLVAKGDIQYLDWPDFEPAAGMLKVRMRACGICGSDIPRVHGDAAHFYPVVLGHEFSGDVVALGAGVENFAIGNRVAGAPLLPCLSCSDCQQGHYALCRNYSFIGSRAPGAFAEFVQLPARNAVKIQSVVSYEAGALFEPATVALHGLLQADYRGGGDVAILGGGNIGILTAQWAKLLGARTVTVFDIDDDRLALAKKLGADVVINTTWPDFAQSAAEWTDGRGYDFVFETAGQPATLQLGFDLVRNKGAMGCIGTPSRPVTFSPEQWEKLNRKEFHLTGSWMSYSAPFPGREWSLTADYFGTGALQLDASMIYRRFALSEIRNAFDLFLTPSAVKGKVLILND
jgi:L-iditol 2-dehydrogenase